MIYLIRSGNLTHRTRGLPKGQNPECVPSNRRAYIPFGVFISGLYRLSKPPGPMEQWTRFQLGFSFRASISFPNRQSPGKINQFPIRVFTLDAYNVEKCTWLWQAVARWHINTRDWSKKWKPGKGRHAWSPQRVHSSDWFSQKNHVAHFNPEMYQSHKILRLRSEMSLLKTSLIPFWANPQSCP